MTTQLVNLIPKFSNNTIQTEHVIFTNRYVCTYTHMNARKFTSIRPQICKEAKSDIWEGLVNKRKRDEELR